MRAAPRGGEERYRRADAREDTLTQPVKLPQKRFKRYNRHYRLMFRQRSRPEKRWYRARPRDRLEIGRFTCPKCPRKSDTKFNLVRHERIIHQAFIARKCPEPRS